MAGGGPALQLSKERTRRARPSHTFGGLFRSLTSQLIQQIVRSNGPGRTLRIFGRRDLGLAWLPGVLMPEGDRRRGAAAENIAFRSRNVGDCLRVGRARTQVAFTVAGVLPQVPATPRRGGARFPMIIGNPEPAVCQDIPLRGADIGRV